MSLQPIPTSYRVLFQTLQDFWWAWYINVVATRLYTLSALDAEKSASHFD